MPTYSRYCKNYLSVEFYEGKHESSGQTLFLFSSGNKVLDLII